MLAERRTGAALGDMQVMSDMLDTGTPAHGAWKFPLAASCRISLSSVSLTTTEAFEAYQL
jgi:hypothetical protein